MTGSASKTVRAFTAALISVMFIISALPSAAFAADTVPEADPVETPVQTAEIQPEDPEESALPENGDDAELPEESVPDVIDGVSWVINDFIKRELGFNKAAVSGILSVIENKCGFIPNAVCDDGSFGICRWNGDRLEALELFCGELQLDSSTVTAQLRFIKQELENDYPDIYGALAGCGDSEEGAAQAAELFNRYCFMTEEDGEDTVAVNNAFWQSLSEDPAKEEHISVYSAEIIAADFFRNEMGFNNAVAAGIMANIYDESGFEADKTGDGGTAYGICQWGPYRRPALERYCKYHDYDVTVLGAQLMYLKIELESDYPKTLKLLLECEDNETGALEAAKLFCKNVEVPKGMSKQIRERQKLTEKMYYPMLCGDEYERIPVDEILK